MVGVHVERVRSAEAHRRRLLAPRLLMAVAAVMAIGGVWAGLLRIGWRLPAPSATLAAVHGPLLVCGLLGTVIGLERAVALGRRWAFGAPLLSAAGGLLLLLGVPGWAGPALFTLGSLALLAAFAAIVRMQPARYTITMALGAAAWLVGNLLWLAGRPLGLAALWWAGFLALTIAGERLELGRLRQLPRRANVAFGAAVAGLLAGMAVAVAAYDAGWRLAGAAMLTLGLWLLRYDVANRTIRKGGLPRYSAACILSGSAWLVAAGLLALWAGGLHGGPLYDALLHAIFVGFVFAMIFGHAPIVVPAVLGVALPFHRTFYLPLAALHLSLGLRVAGDLADAVAVRRWGGLLNAAAILLFAAAAIYGRVRGGPGQQGHRASTAPPFQS